MKKTNVVPMSLLFTVSVIFTGCCKPVSEKLAKTAKEVKSLLVAAPDIEVKIINDKVVIDGFSLSKTDLDRVDQVLKIYEKNQVVSLVSMNHRAMKKLADEIEKEIDNPNIYVAVVNGTLMLEGGESYAGEKRRAERIANDSVRGLFRSQRDLASTGTEKRVLNYIMGTTPLPAPKPNKK